MVTTHPSTQTQLFLYPSMRSPRDYPSCQLVASFVSATLFRRGGISKKEAWGVWRYVKLTLRSAAVVYKSGWVGVKGLAPSTSTSHRVTLPFLGGRCVRLVNKSDSENTVAPPVPRSNFLFCHPRVPQVNLHIVPFNHNLGGNKCQK
jgi:hypothetical protein